MLAMGETRGAMSPCPDPGEKITLRTTWRGVAQVGPLFGEQSHPISSFEAAEMMCATCCSILSFRAGMFACCGQ